MGRNTPSSIELREASDGMERLKAATLSRLLVLLPPWVILGLSLVAGLVSHAKWGQPPAVTWAAMAGTLATVCLTGLTWAVSHQRGTLGRIHAAFSVLGAGIWLTIATVTGAGHPVTFGAWAWGGGALAIGWNIRTVIRRSGGAEGRHGDPLADVFDRAKESFGLKGARVRTEEVTDHKIKGRMALPAGEKTPADVIKRTDYVESGLGFPPGSVHVAADEDDASRAHVTITDPRIMKRPIAWPGPSLPGGSIADPLQVGLFQDMNPVLHTLPGHHLQIMGMSGSGKSIGGAWNYLGEAITRRDVAIFALDISKDEQTLGPLAGGLHGMHLTKASVVQFIRALHEEIPKRTKWLSQHGYQKWAPGCGLAYLLIWVEEAAKVFSGLSSSDEEKLLEILKELRSAGGTIVLSLQRSDYSQMPTIARGQLAHMTFGVANDDDASFGLSKAQQKAEAHPETWGTRQPGMAYLDAPSIPETHIAMPLRTWAWGDTDNQASARMRAHAADYPAAGKPVDEFTARLVAIGDGPPSAALSPAQAAPAATAAHSPAGTATAAHNGTEAAEETAGRDPEDGDAVTDYLTTEDPDPSITAGPDDPILEPEGDLPPTDTVAQAPKLRPEQARRMVHDWIRERAGTGADTFTAGDESLAEVRQRTGMTSRGWIYKVLRDLVDNGVLDTDDSGPVTEYRIVDLDALGAEPAPAL